MRDHSTTPTHGFTLVELSIVLVILGLLVGGVLSGQSLIRAAELRSIVTERDKYTTALNAFQDKYMALPGDMTNAFAFWGQLGLAGCATDTVTDTTNADGCNGNGDGLIGDNTHQIAEPGKAWMHLGQAGLIEGTYPGLVTNIFEGLLPLSKFSGGSWLMHSGWTYGINPTSNPPRGGIALSFTNFGQSASSPPIPGYTHEEAWNIDKKTDDGGAHTGSTRGGESCIDIDLDGDASNGEEDHYGIRAMGPTATTCSTHFLIRR